MIPIAYFFYKNKGKKPSHEQAKLLTHFFWRCSLGGRYSASLESRVAQDVGRIDEILTGKAPLYDWPVHTQPEFILANGWFAPARAFVKAILCIYASSQPRSFDNNAIVNIANDSLKRANSRNYHHFFPRAYLSKKGIPDRLANNILNITMIDAHLNKNQIRAKFGTCLDSFFHSLAYFLSRILWRKARGRTSCRMIMTDFCSDGRRE